MTFPFLSMKKEMQAGLNPFKAGAASISKPVKKLYCVKCVSEILSKDF